MPTADRSAHLKKSEKSEKWNIKGRNRNPAPAGTNGPVKTNKTCGTPTIILTSQTKRNGKAERRWIRCCDSNRHCEKGREKRKSSLWPLAGDVKGLADCAKQNALALASLGSGLQKRSFCIQPPEWAHLHMQMKPGHIVTTEWLDWFVWGDTDTHKAHYASLLCTNAIKGITEGFNQVSQDSTHFTDIKINL